MKQCDRGLSPLAIGSSSLSFPASESDPEDSFWRDFNFDFSFLTSEDQNSGHDDEFDSLSNPSRRANSSSVSKAEESELYGLAANARPVKEKGETSDSFLKLPTFLECVDSKLSPSLPVVSTSRFESNVTIGEEERFQRFPLAKKDINESHFSPLFTKMSALRINQCSNGYVPSDDTEVDSPCWKGNKSLNFKRSRDDLNVLYGLNPLAPQFIPSNAKKDVKEFEENGSSSLKRSLSSTFPPSSGEFSITDSSEAWIEQDSGQRNRTGIVIHDADESLGLGSQDSVSKTMSILDSSNQFQTPRKLDPLAPVFVPACAKPSAVVYEKSGVADHVIGIETNAHTAYALSSSDGMLLNNVKVETHSPEIDHSFRSPYSNNVHESGETYSFNPRFGSQVRISENPKLDRSSNKCHGPKKLNPLAPLFSLADTKPKVYACEKNQAANDLPPKVNSSVLFSPTGYKNQKELHVGVAQSSVHVEPSFNEVDTKQMGRHRPYILHGNSSPQMDVKKLLTTIHGLSELLTHVHGSETLDSPTEQDLDLINCTVQNLHSYISNRAQERAGNYSGAVRSSCDLTSLPNMRKQSIRDYQTPKARNLSAGDDAKRKEKYSMVSGETRADSQFEYCVTKENGFGQVVRNHQTEEQINPQVYFYRSLWLKARADRSLMEYETFLSNSRT